MGYGWRWQWHMVSLEHRTTLDNVKRLDVRWLQRQGYLQPRANGILTWRRGDQEAGSIYVAMQDSNVVVAYRYRPRGTEDWQDVRQVIVLDWTSCHYGGQRPWFLSPSCARRVAVLCGYTQQFLCRHCSGLPYGSQSETPEDRRYRKARKIRERLGASGNLTKPTRPWNKPKGMHWRTWERLREQEEHVHTGITEDMAARLTRLLHRGEGV